MAQISHPFRLAAFFILSLLAVAPAPSSGGGFSLELIHRDSTRSSLYPGNLTATQRLHRLLQLSKAGLPSLESVNVTTARIPLSYVPPMYFVAVAFGTEPQIRSYQLWLHTGSALTWIQCLPCNPCFYQSFHIFNPSRSPTYHFLPTDRCPRGYDVEGHKCVYDMHDHHSQSYIKGVLATDAVTFHSSRGADHFVAMRLMFGCTHASRVPFNGAPQGVLGLDDSRTSFLRQMFTHIEGQYSYCLPLTVQDRSYLRFGSDINMHGETETTVFQTIDGMHYINIVDITIGNQRLHIDPRTFRTRGQYGGSIIDMSSPISRLAPPAYDAVKNYLIAYFGHFNQLHQIPPVHSLDLCYRMAHPFDQFPGMTIHLVGANLHVRWPQVFSVDTEEHMFCLAMETSESSQHRTVIGAYQQVNTKFKFNLNFKLLNFVSEDCSRNG